MNEDNNMINSFYLYKYTSIENLEKILVNNSLYFSNPMNFNDPFDCNYPNIELEYCDFLSIIDPIFTKMFGDEYIQTKNTDQKMFNEVIADTYTQVKNLINVALDSIRDNWDKYINIYRILSLTCNENNVLMWSHYADQHKGCLLKFDFSSSEKFVSKKVSYNYEEEFKKLTISLLSMMFSNKDNSETLNSNSGFGKKIIEYTMNNMHKYFLVKKQDWSYENEYRVVKRIDEINENNLEEFNWCNLKEVTFGLRVRNSSIPDFKKRILLKNQAITVNKAIKQYDKLYYKSV